MPWKVVAKPHFLRDLKGIPEADRRRIQAAINRMVDSMSDAHIIKLSGDDWRLRVGDWRVFMYWDNSTGVISLTGVKRRTSTTY